VVNFHIFYFHTDHKHNISFKAFSFVEQIKPCMYFRWQDHIVSSLYWFFSCWSIAAAVILMMNAENHLVDLTNQLFDSHFNSRKTHRINVLILHFAFIVLKITIPWLCSLPFQVQFNSLLLKLTTYLKLFQFRTQTIAFRKSFWNWNLIVHHFYHTDFISNQKTHWPSSTARQLGNDTWETKIRYLNIHKI
jgi:hypothetical protein